MAEREHKLHTISALVENRPGVLARIAGLFARRGFNIESLAVSITDDPTISRMTIVAGGDEAALEQIRKQLSRLIDVIKVYDHTGEAVVERELALIKVKATSDTRSEIVELANIFRAAIVDVAEDTLIIEVTGDTEKIDAFVHLLKRFGIVEMVRTGRIVLPRGWQPRRERRG